MTQQPNTQRPNIQHSDTRRCNTREQGQHIESRVSHWLTLQGLTLLDRNYVRRIGEIDLVLRETDSGLIVFVEVRYRHDDAFGGGLESVDARKQARLRRTALAWLQQHADPQHSARFDVIAVSPDSGSERLATLPGETAPVAWEGLQMVWIKDAL